MENKDIPIALGGITSPVWLEPLNEWLGLVLVALSIALVVYRLYKAGKD